MEYKIGSDWKDRTVKDYLYGVVGVSRSVLTRLKKREDGILLNGRHVTVRAVLCENDILSIATEDGEDQRIDQIVPVDLPLSIVYEDDYLLVINKAPNMPTHPTHGHYDDTLANALAYRMQKLGGAMVFRAINRLDRDTSGLVIVAKNQLSAAKLARSLQAGQIEKQYIAILAGHLTPKEGSIDRPIHRVSDSIITRECCEEGQGAYALTTYRVLAHMKDRTLVLASPITGRTHQLRVHFTSLGHPILGDSLYGTASDEIARHALHAVSLRFPHPMEERMVTVKAPLPQDMKNCIEKEILDEMD